MAKNQTSDVEAIVEAICGSLMSTSVPDSNMEPSNVVDVIDRVGRRWLAISDDNGRSLAEAVKAASLSLGRIADAISTFGEIYKKSTSARSGGNDDRPSS